METMYISDLCALGECKRKREDIWLGHMTKTLIPTEISKRQHDNTKTSPNSSITKRLRTDLGRSDEVTKVIQLVWLTGLRAQPPHSPQQPCNQMDTHLKKFINKPPYIDNKPTAAPSGEVIKIDTHTA